MDLYDDAPNDASAGGVEEESEVPEEEQSEFVPIGRFGKDERIAFKVTGFEAVDGIHPDEYSGVNARPGATLYQVTLQVKNNGQASNDLFCGGSPAVLIDAANRNYEPVSPLETNTVDATICDSGVAAGFTDTYVLGFQVPKNAKPVELALWNPEGTDYDGEQHDVRITLG